MSNVNSSLAFEELGEQNETIELKLLVKSRSVSGNHVTGNAIFPLRPETQTIKVKGSITVSF